MDMKVLMCGLKFPPHISEGLNAAFNGLKEEFSQKMNLSTGKSYQHNYLINDFAGANDPESDGCVTIDFGWG